MKLWVTLATVIPASVALMTALPQSGSASDRDFVALQTAVWLTDYLRIAKIAVACNLRTEAWQQAVASVAVPDAGVRLRQVYPDAIANNTAAALGFAAHSAADAEITKYGTAACEAVKLEVGQVDQLIDKSEVSPSK